MSAAPSHRADRLGDAVEAFLAFTSGAEGSDAAAFLARHEPLRDLLEPMLAEGAAAPAPPKSLGDYQIVREIGRGGMGVVYEAHQPSLQRSVALKVLWSHLTLSESRVTRFRREAAACAKLGHPAIVPVHEVGEAAGTHFFAMELVAGESLARLLERSPDPRQPLGVLSGKSPAVEAATLGAEVAAALQHAHERGVIHRDVKPGNILLQEGPQGCVVRLVDFGLAKDLDQDTLSRSGELAGTPHYMSPEQAQAGRADVDARTDVWSLGVVLYEMLTRRRPFDGDTAHSILLQIAHREPLSPRRHNPDLPRDLETICLKAIEKEPTRRYATAGALADDLRRFLDHRPILARPQGPVTRAVKMARRRPGAAAAVVLGLLLVATTLVFLLELRSSGDAVIQAKAQARSYLNEVKDAIGSPLNRAVMPQPGEVVPLAVSRQTVEDSLRRCEAFVAAHGSDPAVRAECLDLYRAIAGAYRRLGASDRAADAVRRGLTLAQTLESAGPGSIVAEGVVPGLLSELAVAVAEQGLFAEAERHRREGIRLRQAYLERPDAADRDRVRRELIWELASLGQWLLRQQSTYDEAEQALTSAQAMFAGLAPAAAAEPLAQSVLAHVHNGLSALYNARGRTSEALRHLKLAADARAKISAASPNDLEAKCDHALSLGNFGTLLSTRRPADARVHLETALRLASEALAAQPANPRAQPLVPNCQYLLAKCLDSQGETAAAREHFLAAIARQETLVTERPKLVEPRLLLATMHLHLAWSYERQDQETEAERHLAAAFTAQQSGLELEPGHDAGLRTLPRIVDELSAWLRTRARPSECRAVLVRAIELERRALAELAKFPARQALADAVREKLAVHEMQLADLPAEGRRR